MAKVKRPPTKEELDNLFKLYKKATMRYFDRKRECQHEIIEYKVTEDCSSAHCRICNEPFGWWCPKSPDNLCHYDYRTNGEYCIYCGQPEERK
jgi:hypothetical protein